VFFDESDIMCIIEIYHTNKKTEEDIEKFNKLNTTVYEYNINNGETELLCWTESSEDVRRSEEKKLELWYENTIRRKSERIERDIAEESESAESLRDELKELSESIEGDTKRRNEIKDKREGIEAKLRKSSKRSRDVREKTDRLRTTVGRVERQISDIGKEIKWTEGAVEETKPDKSIYEADDIKEVKSRIESYQELIRGLETEEVVLAIDEMTDFFKDADIPNSFTLSVW